MACNSLRREVLRSFKNLQRTSLSVFKNDESAMKTAKKEITEAFRKNKNITETDSIKELLKLVEDVAHELKMSVTELEETSKPGVYRLKVRPEMFEDSNYKINVKKIPKGLKL